MLHSRAHIRLNNKADAESFVQTLSNYDDTFYIEDFGGKRRVNAKSLIGVINAMLDFNDEMFLVNNADGAIPNPIDAYRVVAA